MLICLCYGVSDNKVRELIAEGKALDLRALRKHCSAGTDCGKCVCDLKKIIDEYNESKSQNDDSEDLKSRRLG